jgi:hypothetical protein
MVSVPLTALSKAKPVADKASRAAWEVEEGDGAGVGVLVADSKEPKGISE